MKRVLRVYVFCMCLRVLRRLRCCVRCLRVFCVCSACVAYVCCLRVLLAFVAAMYCDEVSWSLYIHNEVDDGCVTLRDYAGLCVTLRAAA